MITSSDICEKIDQSLSGEIQHKTFWVDIRPGEGIITDIENHCNSHGCEFFHVMFADNYELFGLPYIADDGVIRKAYPTWFKTDNPRVFVIARNTLPPKQCHIVDDRIRKNPQLTNAIVIIY